MAFDASAIIKLGKQLEVDLANAVIKDVEGSLVDALEAMGNSLIPAQGQSIAQLVESAANPALKQAFNQLLDKLGAQVVPSVPPAA